MTSIEDAFAQDHRWLWAVAWRILGDAADADDAVQEAFHRALARPPVDTSRPWRPWLTTVVANLARDRLRVRRRRAHAGPWLPSPVVDEAPAPEASPEQQAALRETSAWAWIRAAEALSPQQRLVLVLRDVACFDVAETAAAVGITATNVKVTHHRARAAMAEFPERAVAGDVGAASAALAGFLGAISMGDLRAARAYLAADVILRSDGGGRYHAARRPVRGADKVAMLYAKLLRHAPQPVWYALVAANGCACFVAELGPAIGGPGFRVRAPPRFAMLAEADGEGRLVRLFSVVDPAKLGALPSSGA